MANGADTHLAAHEQTYAGFRRLIGYGAVASFVVAAIVVVLIAS